MYVGNDFPSMSPNETRRLTFDFVNDVNAAANETISSAVWTCEVPPELNTLTDSNAPSHVISDPVIINGTQVVQTISGLQPGVIYRMRCIGTTSGGAQPELFSHVRCVAPV